MSIMTSCTCGILKQYAADPEVPIYYTSDSDTALIRIGPADVKQMRYCFFCGGEPNEKKGECQCGELARWSTIVDSIIKYDAEVHEYTIHCGTAKLHCYFCPTCGGKLPADESDAKRFIEPSNEEITEIRQKLADVKTLDQAIAMLGVPDRTIERDATDVQYEKIYNVLPIQRTLLYSGYKTVHLCVQETTDGKLLTSFIRKARS